MELDQRLRDEHRRATLFWIPSHCNIDGNELADDLAKKGTLEPNVTLSHAPSITKIKSSNRRAARRSWTEHWRQSTTTTHFAPRSRDPDPSIVDVHSSLSPQESRWLTWFRSGNLPLRYMLAKSDAAISPRCRCGKDDETRDHFLFHCDQWDLARRKHIEPLYAGMPWAANLDTVLGDQQGRTALFNFIGETRRFS